MDSSSDAVNVERNNFQLLPRFTHGNNWSVRVFDKV